MATKSIISLRGFAGIAIALVLFSICLCQGAGAQTSLSVVATGPISAVASHPATWGQVWQTAISSKGDLVVKDFEIGGLYQFPANGGALITLIAPGTGWTNIGLAIDPWDNLWINDNWNAELIRVPYDTVNGTWNMSDPGAITYQYSWGGGNQSFNTALGIWFQAAAITVGPANGSGTATIVVSAESSGTLYSFSIDGSGNVTNATVVITSMSARARSLAVDGMGNIYLHEDGGTGVLMVPSGTTGLANDKALTRVDPSLANATGVTVDVNGNVYVSDSKAGVYVVPNEGGTPNPMDAVLMAAIPAFANVDFDLVRGIMYVPTALGENGGWTSPSGAVYNDVVAVALSNVSLGSSATGVQGTSQVINFGFAAAVTPASIEIVEAGVTTPDFVIASSGSCVAGTAYVAGNICTVDVALSSHAVGNVSAKLEMLDANGNILASYSLSGVGLVPAVVSGPLSAVAPATTPFQAIWETSITQNGDLIVQDFSAGAMYDFPAGGGAMNTIIASGGMLNGWTEIGVGVNPATNDLLTGNNWAGCFLWDIPYNPATKTWDATKAFQWGGAALNAPPMGGWCHPGPISFNASGVAAIGNENGFDGIIEVPAAAPGSAEPAANSAVLIATGLKGRPRSLALDNAGNIYFIEDGGVAGVMRVAANQSGLTGEGSMTRVDPVVGGKAVLGNIDGVAVDASGNVYISDSKLGVVLVPIVNGTPYPDGAYLFSAIPADANVDFDVARGIMYVPTTSTANGGWVAPNGVTYNDFVAVALANVNLGSVASGTQGTASTVNFGLLEGVTPASFTIEEAGSTTPDFVVVSGGTCVAGTTYAAMSNCSVNVALSPHSAGGVSGKLVMADAQKNVLASITLFGTGQASAISVTPAIEIPVGANLNTPGEVATDAAGNIYVADAGLKTVLEYPAGATASTAGVPVGTGLKAPTGVAVNGAGDVFIADSGNVIEVPNTPGGLNAAGQMTLKTGLGANVNLAVDGLGNLFIADPSSTRVAMLANPGGTLILNQVEKDWTGFTAPSLVAVDGSNNLYVIDEPNLEEIMTDGTKSTLLTNVSGATGLAVDASGAVYISSNTGTVRIPFVNSALDTNTGDWTTIAATVTNPTGIALDKSGNVYLADGTAKALHEVSINGIASAGAPPLGSVGTAVANVLNIGNTALTVTGFLSSDAVDFSAAGCTNSVASGAVCIVDLTMNPGPGIQGPISSVITVQSDAANSPVVVDVSGVAAPLALSKITVSVGSSANVLNIPVTISVASAAGSGVTATGNVILSVDGVAGAPAALVGGTVTVTLSGIPAGSHTFSVHYIGDRVYGSSTASISAVVGKANPLMTVPNIKAPGYVLADATKPYDGSLNSYSTNYVVTVAGATGLVPTGTLAFNQGSTAWCGPNSSTVNGIPTGLTEGSFNLDATGSATFLPGCLQISTNTNTPNELTPQTITSIVYGGDANYLPFTVSTTANGSPIKFLEIRQPSVLISPNPGAITVPAATYPATGSASTTLTITSLLGFGVSTNPAYPSSTPTLMLNNYTLPIAFNCAGLPAHATCTFSGGNYTDLNEVLHTDEVLVDTDPSKPSTIKVTVTTNVSAGTTTSQNSHSTPYEYAAIFGLGMVGLALNRKSLRKKGFLVLICLLTLAAATACLTACNTVQLGSQAILGTPTQSTPYAVTVTAQQVGGITIPGSKGTPITLYGSTNQMSIPYTLNVTVQ